jgi:hypothetical protein
MYPTYNTDNSEYDKLYELFGIEDILKENNITNHVYSISLYVPMDLNGIEAKISMYYTGLIKHMVLHKYRAEDYDESLLYIYYDAMLDKYIDATDYSTNSENEDFNKTVKTNYKKNKARLECLLELYAIALNKIKTDRKTYEHIRLFSYDSQYFEKKAKFMGHHDVFGSIVRFLPLFDNRIDQTSILNVSHVLTPRLARIINIFRDLPDRYILSGFLNYKGQLFNYPHYKILNKYGVFDDIYQHVSNLPYEVLYGGCSSFKNKKIRFFSMYKMITRLIHAQNANPTKDIFKYGIDEIVLTTCINVEYEHCMSLIFEKIKIKNDTPFKSINMDNIGYKLQEDDVKFILASRAYIKNLTRDIYTHIADTFVGEYRYWPRAHDIEIQYNSMFGNTNSKDIKSYLGKINPAYNNFYTSSLVSLLYGYDEYNPILINFAPHDKRSKHMYNLIFTVFELEDPTILSDRVFKYMNNDDLVVKKPYIIDDNFVKDMFYNTSDSIKKYTILLENAINLNNMNNTLYLSKILLGDTNKNNIAKNIPKYRKNSKNTIKHMNRNPLQKTHTRTSKLKARN